MNKGLVAGVAILAVAGTGVGGFFVIEHQVRSTVEEAFATAPKDSPFVTSASYGAMALDLMADQLTLENVAFKADLGALDEYVTKAQPGMHIHGSADQSHDILVLHGIWDMVFGGQTVRQVDVGATTFSGTLVQTIDNPNSVVVNGEQFVQPGARAKSATITTTFDGSFAKGQVLGLDLSAIGNASTMAPLNVAMEDYVAEDLKMAIALKPDIEAIAPQSAQDMATGRQKLPLMHADVSIARMVGHDVSPTYYGLIRYDDVVFDMENPDPGADPIHLTIGEVSMSDTELVDFQAVRATTELKDMVFDTSKLENPKGRAIMAMLGIDQISVDMKMSYALDPAQKTLKVSPFRLGLKQAGSIDVSFALEGVPDMNVFAEIQKHQGDQEKINAALDDAFKDIALDEVGVGYKDAGVLKKLIASQALQMNASHEQLAQAYAGQGAMIVKATHGEEKSQTAQETLTAFLTEPDALRINLKAKLPIKIKDLVADFKANGPVALKAFQLDILGGAEAGLN